MHHCKSDVWDECRRVVQCRSWWMCSHRCFLVTLMIHSQRHLKQGITTPWWDGWIRERKWKHLLKHPLLFPNHHDYEVDDWVKGRGNIHLVLFQKLFSAYFPNCSFFLRKLPKTFFLCIVTDPKSSSSCSLKVKTNEVHVCQKCKLWSQCTKTRQFSGDQRCKWRAN